MLSSALRSPQCSELFTLPSSVKTLPAVFTNIHPAFTNHHGWERVLERAVGQEYDRYELDQDVIRKDAQFIATEAVPASRSVHCELKIALEMMKNGNEAYSYIGVSKLSCKGYEALFSAINFVHLTKFCTKGSREKSYYPWMFPRHFSRGQEVAAESYRILPQFWIAAYHGYPVKRVSQFPDSTA